MLVLSSAKVTIRETGEIDVEGWLKRHRVKIVHFLQDMGLTHGTIRHRFGRFVFSKEIDRGAEQRLRNFLINECPMK